MGVVPREGGLAAANQFVRTGAMPVLRPVAVLPPAVLPPAVPVIVRGARALQVAVHPEILPVFVPAMVLPVVVQPIVRGVEAARGPVAALVQTPRPEVAENASSAAAAQRNFAAPTGCPQDR